MITDRVLIDCLDTSWPDWEVISGFNFLGNRRWGNRFMDESWDSSADMIKRLQRMKREGYKFSSLELASSTAIFLTLCVAVSTAYDAGENVA
jgi:hypothetical protein